MREPTIRPVTISTVGDLIDRRMSLSAHCGVCGRSSRVDLEALAARVGRDAVYVGGALRLVCAGCGARDVSITVAPTGLDDGHRPTRGR